MTWHPLCYLPDELRTWDGVRPCSDCLPAFHLSRLAEGTCNKPASRAGRPILVSADPKLNRRRELHRAWYWRKALEHA